MKVYLDNIIFSKSKNGGISNYWFELICYLQKNSDYIIKYFEDNGCKSNFHRNKLNLLSEDIVFNKYNTLNRLLPLNLKSDEKFVYHSSYYRGLNGSPNKIEVTTVYDFIHTYYSTFPNKQLHNILKFNTIKRSKGIICISHNTYNDLNKFYNLKKHQNATVIHVGVSDDYYQIKNIADMNFYKDNRLEEDYIVFVGGRTNYKNFKFVVEILNNKPNLKLVVVGGGPLNKNELALFSKDAFNRLKLFKSLENHDLNILLNAAKALVYPSSYEGFGIPVVEAMRAGCPVIGLNNATIREVAANSAILIDDLNISEFKTKFELLSIKDFRQQKILSGLEESKKYSWEKCSRETNEFYDFLIKKN